MAKRKKEHEGIPHKGIPNEGIFFLPPPPEDVGVGEGEARIMGSASREPKVIEGQVERDSDTNPTVMHLEDYRGRIRRASSPEEVERLQREAAGVLRAYEEARRNIGKEVNPRVVEAFSALTSASPAPGEENTPRREGSAEAFTEEIRMLYKEITDFTAKDTGGDGTEGIERLRRKLFDLQNRYVQAFPQDENYLTFKNNDRALYPYNAIMIRALWTLLASRITDPKTSPGPERIGDPWKNTEDTLAAVPMDGDDEGFPTAPTPVGPSPTEEAASKEISPSIDSEILRKIKKSKHVQRNREAMYSEKVKNYLGFTRKLNDIERKIDEYISGRPEDIQMVANECQDLETLVKQLYSVRPESSIAYEREVIEDFYKRLEKAKKEINKAKRLRETSLRSRRGIPRLEEIRNIEPLPEPPPKRSATDSAKDSLFATLGRGLRYLLGDNEAIPPAETSTSRLSELAGIGLTYVFNLGTARLEQEHQRLEQEIANSRKDQQALAASIEASRYLTRARKEELKSQLESLRQKFEAAVGGKEEAYERETRELVRDFMEANPREMTATAALGFMIDNRVARSLHDAAARFRGIVPSSSKQRAQEKVQEWFSNEWFVDTQTKEEQRKKEQAQRRALGVLGRRVGLAVSAAGGAATTAYILAGIINRLHDDPEHGFTTNPQKEESVQTIDLEDEDVAPDNSEMPKQNTQDQSSELAPTTYPKEANIRTGDGFTHVLRRVITAYPEKYSDLSSSDELTRDLNISRMLARDGLLDKWLVKTADIYIVPKMGKDGKWHAAIFDQKTGDELTIRTAIRRGIIIPSQAKEETAH